MQLHERCLTPRTGRSISREAASADYCRDDAKSCHVRIICVVVYPTYFWFSHNQDGTPISRSTQLIFSRQITVATILFESGLPPNCKSAQGCDAATTTRPICRRPADADGGQHVSSASATVG